MAVRLLISETWWTGSRQETTESLILKCMVRNSIQIQTQQYFISLTYFLAFVEMVESSPERDDEPNKPKLDSYVTNTSVSTTAKK